MYLPTTFCFLRFVSVYYAFIHSLFLYFINPFVIPYLRLFQRLDLYILGRNAIMMHIPIPQYMPRSPCELEVVQITPLRLRRHRLPHLQRPLNPPL